MSTTEPIPNPNQDIVAAGLWPEDPEGITPASTEGLDRGQHGLVVPNGATSTDLERKLLESAMDSGYGEFYERARRIVDEDSHRKRQTQLETAVTEAETRDQLTGLLNMAGMVKAINERVSGAADGSFGILYLDLNGFKQVNDLYGHAKGDKTLKEVAERLRKKMRHQDAETKDQVARNTGQPDDEEAARLGGDEFVVLVDLTPRQNTEMSAEERLATVKNRVRDLIEQDVVQQDPDLVRVGMGVAIGAQIWTHEFPDADALLAGADKAMYEDKAGAAR